MLTDLFFLAQTTSASSESGGSGFILFVYGLTLLVYAICLWVIFEKANEEGWTALVPIYNFYILCRIIDVPSWYVILLLIPGVNFFVWLFFLMELARAFGKDDAFGCGLIIMPIICFPILAFGDAQYKYKLPPPLEE